MNDIVSLISSFRNLFNDVPTQTTFLKYDIDVAGAKPMKHHPYRVNQVKRDLMKGRQTTC